MCLSQPTTPLPFLIVPDHDHTINLISPDPKFLVEPAQCLFQDIQWCYPGSEQQWIMTPQHWQWQQNNNDNWAGGIFSFE